MILSNFITQAVDQDFSLVSTTIPFWIIALTGAIILVISAIAGFYFGEVVAGFFVMMVLGIFGIIVVLVIETVMDSENSPDDNVKKIQSWVQDEYLIDITEPQAEYLIEHQIKLSDIPDSESPVSPIVIENAYGNIVSITLVKKGQEWILVQQEDIGIHNLTESK
jgi:energy-coupling factor transporter transmembrane protein EcfT